MRLGEVIYYSLIREGTTTTLDAGKILSYVQLKCLNSFRSEQTRYIIADSFSLIRSSINEKTRLCGFPHNRDVELCFHPKTHTSTITGRRQRRREDHDIAHTGGRNRYR